MEIHLKYIPPVIVDQQHQVTGDLADCWDREKGEMGEEWIAKRKSPPTGRPGSPCYHVGCDPVPAVANNGSGGRANKTTAADAAVALLLSRNPSVPEHSDPQSKGSVIFIEQPFDCSRSKLV